MSFPAAGELGQPDEDVELQVLGEHRLERLQPSMSCMRPCRFTKSMLAFPNHDVVTRIPRVADLSPITPARACTDSKPTTSFQRLA